MDPKPDREISSSTSGTSLLVPGISSPGRFGSSSLRTTPPPPGFRLDPVESHHRVTLTELQISTYLSSATSSFTDVIRCPYIPCQCSAIDFNTGFKRPRVGHGGQCLIPYDSGQELQVIHTLGNTAKITSHSSDKDWSPSPERSTYRQPPVMEIGIKGQNQPPVRLIEVSLRASPGTHRH